MSGVLIVTGSSQGIGAATARLAARHGYDVCVTALSEMDRAEEVAADIRAVGRNSCVVQVDVGDPAKVTAMFATAEAELGQITGLVNNAGILGPRSRQDDLDFEDLQRVFMTNAIGTFNCSKQAVPRLSTARGGKGGGIVNISSVLAKFGAPGEYVHYAATKGAIEALTIGLASEVAGEGIRVNAVRPGLTDTEIFVRIGDENRIARVAPSIPMKRAAQPEEIAEAVIWLLSDKSSYVTGAILDVGGGR